MRIEVIGKHFEVTDAIAKYAEQKGSKLPRFYDGVQEIDVVIEQGAKGEGFRVELRVDVEKHDTFVAKSNGPDVYECIDLGVDKMSRQLTDFKERLRNSKR